MTEQTSDTLVVELTPRGRGAVAVILVNGPQAIEAVRNFFVPSSPWPTAGPKQGRIFFGRWSADAANTPGEELVVCPRGDAEVEIHCHGGGAAAPAIVRQLVRFGLHEIAWPEWVRRTSPDPIQAKARIALADATTQRAAAVLLDQFHGALADAIQSTLQAVGCNDWSAARQAVADILKFRDVGLHLTAPWRVVLAGPPNVGKSSLMNAIAGYQRAIVSPIPGTTRDVVTIDTAIDGWPVQLADTAGLRDTADSLESAGVTLAHEAASRADLVLAVTDLAQHDSIVAATNVAARAPRVIHVGNKIDLLPRHAARERKSAGEPSSSTGALAVSARTGEGLPELVAAIARALVPALPPPGAAVSFTPAQVASLEAAQAAIDQTDGKLAVKALRALVAAG